MRLFTPKIADVKLLIMPSIVAFITPIHTMLQLMIAAVVVDLIFGIWKAVKNKVRITSRGLQVTFTKSILYTIFTLLGHGVDLVFFDGQYLAKYFAMAVISTELFSIVENLEAILNINILDKLKERLSFKKIK